MASPAPNPAAALVDERAARAALERNLHDARATIAALQMQLAAARTSAAARAAAPSEDRRAAPPLVPKPRQGADREVLSDCSEFSTPKRDAEPRATRRKTPPVGVAGVRKKKSKERMPKAKIPGQSRYWTPEEHKLFLEALRQYGHKDLRSISAYVGTRNMTQVRTHSQKYFMRLMREAKRQNPSAAATSPAPTEAVAPAAEPPADSTAAADARNAPAAEAHSDKYSVPNTCGMTLLCLVGQDTLSN